MDYFKIIAQLFRFVIFLCALFCLCQSDETVYQSGGQQPLNVRAAMQKRYLLYDINPGEGFNLRRDVYMRIANMVKVLNEEQDWTLVLPPWGRLYHWKTRDINQMKIPWSTFFDVESLNRYIPVMEFEDYIKGIDEPLDVVLIKYKFPAISVTHSKGMLTPIEYITGKAEIDVIWHLQSYAEGWTDGKWEEKIDERECIDRPIYNKNDKGVYKGWFWGYSEAYAKDFKCLSVQAMATRMVPLLQHNTSARSVMLDRAEELLHDHFGRAAYWNARRSMRFAHHLQRIGDKFREEFLDSSDEKDQTQVAADWRDTKREPGSAVGGPYLAVHLRRQDYARSSRKDAPSLAAAAKQIKKILKTQKLKKVFLATDAPMSEINELKENLKKFEVFNYVPPKSVLEKYMDGGVAIIDQWICAHGRYFIGTGVSTFSFRIHEERQILGFDPKTTYNRFCGDKEEENCNQPTVWNIVW